jgi:ketosteroid isomerase-like protein
VSRERNVEIVRRIYASWAHGDLRAAAALLDPRTVFETFMPDSSERVVCRSPEEIEGFMREWFAQWRDYRILGDEFHDAGSDKVLVLGRQAGIGRQSGVEVEGPHHSVWTFENGRVVRLVVETDRQRALEAAGLSDPS